MGKKALIQLLLLQVISLSHSSRAEGKDYWNILKCIIDGRKSSSSSCSDQDERLGMSVKNWCESWRLNVELNNVRDFDVVPGECVDYVGKYMGSTQYKADIQRAAEEAKLFLTSSFTLAADGLDAWVFDVDDTLLSTIPYYKKHNYGAVLECSGDKMNRSSIEAWMKKGDAPANEHVLDLYEDVRRRGLKIFIVSSRGDQLREATVDNLIKVGYRGWTQLILRCSEDAFDGVEKYKAEQRKQLISRGYRLWGIVGDQWSSLLGHSNARRTFKLPNVMYFDA